ncbi:uncharacterized protein METZ01_LOCUS426106, partial [marine metagenome]
VNIQSGSGRGVFLAKDDKYATLTQN